MITHLNSDFKPVVRYGKELPGYYCNQRGQIFSVKRNKFLAPKPKWSARLKEEGNRFRCYSYILSIPKGLFEDYDHRARGKSHSPAISVDAHRAVMETWRPIDQYPPEMVAECWNEIPEPAKEWIRRTAYVDHIDDDPANNNVDNLRWVMPIENQSFRKAAAKNA
jgi:HNH endonuclease